MSFLHVQQSLSLNQKCLFRLETYSTRTNQADSEEFGTISAPLSGAEYPSYALSTYGAADVRRLANFRITLKANNVSYSKFLPKLRSLAQKGKMLN